MIDPANAQARGGDAAPSPIGVVYDTSMSRPDAALALAAMCVFDNRHEAKIGAVCVNGAGLDTAIFCDMVERTYMSGGPRNGNQLLPVGLADVTPLPPDSPMVTAAVTRKTAGGRASYPHSIERVTDTGQAQALLRNGVIFNAEAVVILSAPATWLAKTLDLLGAKQEYVKRVRRFVVVDDGRPQADPAALRRIIAEWPTPIVYAGPDVGDALMFPGARVDAAFGWAPAHPVVDAYHAFRTMPYDAPSHDLAAMYYAVHPASVFFSLSEPGALSVAASGGVTFTPGAGTVRRLVVDVARRAQALEALVAVVSTKPVEPPARGGGA